MTDLSSLFTPFKLGNLELPNRIVMAPMTRCQSPDYTPGPDVAAYYARRAKGGTGLIITEGTTVDHPVATANDTIPAFHGRALEGWKAVLAEVHAAGGLIMPQLWHLGMARNPATSPDPSLPSAGPSGLVSPGKRMTEPMRDEDIQDVVDAFARAAADAQTLGFDGVELHGAHGYLIDQFFWVGTNERTDIWGGDHVGRTRFGVEVVRAVRRAVGKEFPVVLRWSQWKMGDYAVRLVETPRELEQFLQPLAAAGVTAFHCSTRRFWDTEFPDSGAELNLAGWTKRLTGLPTISVGSVGLSKADEVATRGEKINVSVANLELLATAVARGDFDLVAVGRALLANPEWPMLVREGRFDELVDYSGDALATLY
ncbi:MAG: NADH:flavin oxidoreductase [Sphingomonadaceae bacterium]|nr:NADH:flavin oxidoreductase [Sphingomonadaceae bacterium]